MQGQCFCGEIRYELKSEIQDAYICHCRDCQYFSGSAFHALGIVNRENFRIVRGEPKTFTHDTQDHSKLTRAFCPNCGTPLFNISTRFDDIVMLTINTLDHPQQVRPLFQIWTSSKLAWTDGLPGLKCHPYGALDGDVAP